jgi:hypothetical protein
MKRLLRMQQIVHNMLDYKTDFVHYINVINTGKRNEQGVTILQCIHFQNTRLCQIKCILFYILPCSELTIIIIFTYFLVYRRSVTFYLLS